MRTWVNFNPLCANPTMLSVFGHFVGLALKGLSEIKNVLARQSDKTVDSATITLTESKDL